MGNPCLALGRMEVLNSTSLSTTIVVFSMAFLERLLDAVKKPIPVRLLSTLVKLLVGTWPAFGWFSSVGRGGLSSTVQPILAYRKEWQQQQSSVVVETCLKLLKTVEG